MGKFINYVTSQFASIFRSFQKLSNQNLKIPIFLRKIYDPEKWRDVIYKLPHPIILILVLRENTFKATLWEEIKNSHKIFRRWKLQMRSTGVSLVSLAVEQERDDDTGSNIETSFVVFRRHRLNSSECDDLLEWICIIFYEFLFENKSTKAATSLFIRLKAFRSDSTWRGSHVIWRLLNTLNVGSLTDLSRCFWLLKLSEACIVIQKLGFLGITDKLTPNFRWRCTKKSNHALKTQRSKIFTCLAGIAKKLSRISFRQFFQAVWRL